MQLISQIFTSRLRNQPEGFYILLYTETCELFGQFAITALLVLYMSSMLKTSDTQAFTCYASFTAFIYAIPLLGGYFADRISGFKYSLFLGIALMMLGNLFLIIPTLHALYFGLSIFSVGCGFFTPAITAVLGRLYASHEEQRDNAFILYYIAKNVGALFATLVCSYIAVKFGYNYAYLLSTVVMLSGYLVFKQGHKKLQPYLISKVEENFSIRIKISLCLVAVIGLIFITEIVMLTNSSTILMLIISSIACLVILYLYIKFNKEEKTKLTLILFSVVMMIVFSMFLGEGGTTLNLFISRVIDRTIGAYNIPPSMFYALDPFFMIVFGTLVMSFLDKIKGKNETIIGFFKISFGLAILGIGFLVFSAAALSMVHNHIKPNVGYVVIAYTLFPISELCIMPIVISLITRISPTGYDGFMIGIYMLGNAIASYLTGTFSKVANINFPINNLVSLIKASSIYQNTFLLSAILLFVCSLTSWLLILLYQHVSTIKIKEQQQTLVLE